VSLVFVGPQTWWGLIGLVPLVTGLIGTCPVYSILGINTCPMKNGLRSVARHNWLRLQSPQPTVSQEYKK